MEELKKLRAKEARIQELIEKLEVIEMNNNGYSPSNTHIQAAKAMAEYIDNDLVSRLVTTICSE